MRLREVEKLTQIPAFADEEEEARWWAGHELGGEALEQMAPLDRRLDPLPPWPSREESEARCGKLRTEFDERLRARRERLNPL